MNEEAANSEEMSLAQDAEGDLEAEEYQEVLADMDDRERASSDAFDFSSDDKAVWLEKLFPWVRLQRDHKVWDIVMTEVLRIIKAPWRAW